MWYSAVEQGGYITKGWIFWAALVLTFLSLVLFSLTRSYALISPNRRGALIACGGFPTLAIFLSFLLALAPRSSLLLGALASVVRVAGCYLVFTHCVALSHGSVSVFKLCKLANKGHRSLSEFRSKHRALSAALNCIFLDLILTLSLHLSILLFSRNSAHLTNSSLTSHLTRDVMVFPGRLPGNPLLIGYHTALGLAALLGLAGALRVAKVVGQGTVRFVPVLSRVVSFLLIALQVGLSARIQEQVIERERRASVAEFCLYLGAAAVVVQFGELAVVAGLVKAEAKRWRRERVVVVVEERCGREERLLSLSDTALESGGGGGLKRTPRNGSFTSINTC